MTTGRPPGPLLPVRTVVILVVATLIGMTVGVLTWPQTRSLAAAVLAGLTAFGVSIPVMHRLVE